MSTSPRYIAVRLYSEVFGPLPKDDLEYVKQYPTDLLLEWLSKINAILFQEPDIQAQTVAVFESLFPGADAGQLFGLWKHEPKAYFSAPAIAGLIKACLENFVGNEGSAPVYLHEFSPNLFRTILIFNEIHYRSRPEIKLDSFEGVFRLDILQQSYIRSTLYYKTFSAIRFAFVAKYLVQAFELKEECKEFCEYYQVGNPWLFGRFFLDILKAISSEENFGKHILELRGGASKIVDELTIEPDQLRTRESLSVNMDIIPKPFYRTRQGVLILDYNFFQFPIDQGVFHLIYKSTSLSKRKKFNSFDAFRAHIGYHYFEQFLVKQYLSAIFWRRDQKIVSTDQYQDFIIKSSSNRVLIIEVKNTTVHAKTLEAMDFSGFKSIIDDNFLSEKTATSKNKGVSQILKQVSNLLSAGSDLRKQLGLKPNSALKIYPIILYSDANFDISGVNSYVGGHFQTKLDGLFGAGRNVIRPLTLVNISVLIDHFAKLKRTPSLFTELIAHYFSSVRKHRARYEREGHSHHYYVSSKSFANYLKDKLGVDALEENLPAMEKSFDLDIPAVR